MTKILNQTVEKVSDCCFAKYTFGPFTNEGKMTTIDCMECGAPCKPMLKPCTEKLCDGSGVLTEGEHDDIRERACPCTRIED